jgi:hypothetical protein
MRSWFSAILAASFLACASAPASATPVIFHLMGTTCTTDCDVIGLSAGDAISASFTVDSSLTGVGSTLGTADLEDFTFDAGTIHVSSASAQFVFFSGQFQADGFHLADFLATNAIAPAKGDGFGLGPFSWNAGSETFYQEIAGVGAFTNLSHTSGHMGPFVAEDSAVPEPATLALFGFGLLGLRRRKR